MTETNQERLARQAARRKRLHVWWWSLPEKERAAIREQFMHRYETEPEFARRVRQVMGARAED